MDYKEKFKDPRWQKKRLEILERDEWCCRICFDDKSTLNVHHRYYIKNRAPWEYKLCELVTLCEKCHKKETLLKKENIGFIFNELSLCFFQEDIERLELGLLNSNFGYPSEVIAEMIKNLLLFPQLQTLFMDFLTFKRI